MSCRARFQRPRASVRHRRSGYESLAAGCEALVFGPQRLGQLPLLGTDADREARPAQHRGGQEAPRIITGQRDPGEHERDPAVGRVADIPVRPASHHPVLGLDLDDAGNGQRNARHDRPHQATRPGQPAQWRPGAGARWRPPGWQGPESDGRALPLVSEWGLRDHAVTRFAISAARPVVAGRRSGGGDDDHAVARGGWPAGRAAPPRGQRVRPGRSSGRRSGRPRTGTPHPSCPGGSRSRR